MRAHILLLRPAALLAFAGLALAQAPAITSFTGNTQVGTVEPFPGSDRTVGFNFTANSNLTVSALGVWEDPANGTAPLTQTHQVGLWNSSGTLLASATVLTNSPLTGRWRYVSVTPVTLTAGQTYFAGSAITSPYSDTFARVAGTVTSSPLITVGNAVANAVAAGFSFPNLTDTTALGRFGPNLMIQAAPSTPPTAVPISSAALIAVGIGLALLAAFAMAMQRPLSGDIQ
jgi:hypothetical protein